MATLGDLAAKQANFGAQLAAKVAAAQGNVQDAKDATNDTDLAAALSRLDDNLSAISNLTLPDVPVQ